MVYQGISGILRAARRQGGAYLCLALSLMLAGCEEPRPRTFADFTEDRIAREGTLARCNADREATLNDIECANARRAQASIALSRERERREQLELESERRIAALTAEMAERERIAKEEAMRATRAAYEAYEKLWSQQRSDAGDGVPAPGLDSESGFDAGSGFDSAAADELVAPVALVAPDEPASIAAQTVPVADE